MTDPRHPGKPSPPREHHPPNDAEQFGADDETRDDAIIGKAAAWSVGIFLVLAAAIGGAVWVITRPAPEAETIIVDTPAPERIRVEVEPPALPFTDVTGEAGIDFVHVSGAAGEKLLPETMGGGAAFLDADGDGDQDLLLVNGAYWPDDPRSADQPTSRLYRNDGAGRFTDVTEEAGLDVVLYGMGAAVGDVDGDGDQDIFITAVGENRLLRNDGGVFTDVTSEAGVAGEAADWSTSAGFFDPDRDGDLDLFVCNYIEWSRPIDLEADYRLTGIGRAYGPPTNFNGAHSRLYRNRGDGTFEDVSAEAGIRVTNPVTGVPSGKALAVVFSDLDDDGWPDVIVANDTVQNFVFRNRGDGTFEEIGASCGLGYDAMGSATGAMGIDVADFRNDRSTGVAVGNFANEMTSLYLADADPWRFADVAVAEGVGARSRQALSFGLFFFDADLDGRLDLLQANGHVEDEINTVQSSQHYRQPAQLFWNAGPEARASFILVPPEQTADLATPIVGRGAAYADIDDDGDLDVLLTQIGGAPLLLRNDTPPADVVRLRLVGTRSNPDAIGAIVELTDGATTQRRTVMPTRSYLSQVERPVTFGLGGDGAAGPLRLRITWPSGTTQIVDEVPRNRTVTITEPDAS